MRRLLSIIPLVLCLTGGGMKCRAHDFPLQEVTHDEASWIDTTPFAGKLVIPETAQSFAFSSASTNDNGTVATASEDQPQYRNIFAEFNGPAEFGIYWDSRIKKGSKWGYRVGIGIEEIRMHGLDARGVITFPLEANGLFGRGYNYFEAGLGFAPSVARDYRRCHNFTDLGGLVECNDGIHHRIIKSVFVWRVFADIGYRYQRKSGFMLRAGFTPMIQGEKNWAEFSLSLIPYVSLGYTFR